MENQQIEKADLQRLSFRDLLYKYIRFLPLYVFFIILAFFGAWLYLRYAQEKYSAMGTILINTGVSSSSDKVDELMSGGLKEKSIQNEIEVLHSRPLLIRVVKKLNLQLSYTAKGKVKDMNVYKVGPFIMQPLQLADSNASFSLSVEILDKRQFSINNTIYNFGQAFHLPQGTFKLIETSAPAPGAQYEIDYTPAEAMAAILAPAVNVQPKLQGTGILTVVHETTNPYLAADIVNAVMSEYNAMSVEQNTLSLTSKIEFADKRLKELQTDIDSIKNKLIRFQKSNSLVSAEMQIEGHLTEVRDQSNIEQAQQVTLASLSLIENYLNSGTHTYSATLIPSNLGITDVTLNAMISRYNEAQLQRKTLLESNVTEDNPRIAVLNEGIEALRKNILESVHILKRNYQQTRGIASAEKNKNRNDALNLPEKATGQQDLERQLKSKQTLYDILNENRELGALSVSGVLSGGKILEQAAANDHPVAPNGKTIKLAALLLGLLIPTGLILLREVLNDRVTIRSDIQRVTDTPILGEIGHSNIEKTLVVNKLNRSLLAEQFRILRSNLQYIIGKDDKAVLLVTSSFSGEGKSFISTNIGAVLALTGKKTVILEFDLRKPRILTGLNMSRKPGFSNFMVGNKTLNEIIIPVQDEAHLFILPCGPIPPNPAELLLNEKIGELFTQLRAQFNYVIIDTAPVGMVSDALTLSKYADCTLYVTRQNRTFKKQIGLIDEMYRAKKLPRLSIVLNDVKMPTGGGYYGNYGYGYYGSRGNDGYYDDENHSKGVGQRIIEMINPVNWFRAK
ncbi:MAG: polysaccharide biosynthesis tyrosine autokinase [Niabella sp.]